MHCTSILSSKGDFRVNQLKNKLKDKNSKKFAGSLIIPLYENKWFMLEYLKRLYLIAISKFNNSKFQNLTCQQFKISKFNIFKIQKIRITNFKISQNKIK